MRIKWLSVACFEIENGKEHIVLDPFITLNEQSPCTWKDVERCDIISLSHSHYDHIADIPALMKAFDPIVVCGNNTAIPLAEWTDENPMRFYPMTPNLELDFGWVKIKALFGIHSKLKGTYSNVMEFLSQYETLEGLSGIEDLQTIGTFEFRNYVFEFPDGKKVLHWGNEFTQVQINQLKGLNPDVAILQATSQQVSNPDAYAQFVHDIGAKAVIPHHMDLYRSEEEWHPVIKKLKEKVIERNPEVNFIIPKHGEWIDFI